VSNRVRLVLADGHRSIFREVLGVGRHRCRIEWTKALGGVTNFIPPGFDEPLVISEVDAVEAIVRVTGDGRVSLRRRRMALDLLDGWVIHENGKLDPATHELVRFPATVARVPHFVLWVGPLPAGERRAAYRPAGWRRENRQRLRGTWGEVKS
jgi:hypothetical protein